MKRTLLSLCALLLMLSMLLCGCVPTEQATTAGKGTTAAVTTAPAGTTASTVGTTAGTTAGTTTEEVTTSDPTPPVVDTPVTVTEKYFPDIVAQRINTFFVAQKESVSPFSTQYAPYAYPDVYTLSGCTVKSISIPVIQTKNVDADGNFTFTIFVFGNSFDRMKIAAKRSYPIKINAEEYNLTPNASNVYQYIKVDLDDYDIVLENNETMAFFASTDTLIPAYTGPARSNRLSQLMMQAFEQATGFYRSVGTANIAINQGMFFFDFELERTYPSERVYEEVLGAEELLEEKIIALQEIYADKYLSIIGDSISTFTGVSNNGKYNSTITQNWVYYTTDNNTLYDETDTYWGRVMKELDMKLCVPNAWSGSFVYGRADTNRVDNIVNRATELDNDNGTPNDPTDDIAPDLIFVYIGINDLNNNSPFGDLYDLIQGQSEERIIARTASWFERTVLPQAEETNGIIAGETYTTWEQAYALGIYAMQEKYPDAEIVILTLAENNHGSPRDKIAKYNACIKAIGGYFGATVIEQSAIVTQANCHAYGSDNTALHPSSYGHKRMAELIINTLYDKHCGDDCGLE